MQTDTSEHHRELVFRPNRLRFPGKILLNPLRLGLITTPFALFEIPYAQTFQMLLKRLANQGGSIHLLPLSCNVRGLQQLRVQNNLNGFHCGLSSTVYPTYPLALARLVRPANAPNATDIISVAMRNSIPASLAIVGAAWILLGAGGKSDKIDTKDLVTGQQAFSDYQKE